MTGEGGSDDSTKRDERETVDPLSLLVGEEARRAFSEAQLRADPARLAAGWERRFLADAHRVREAMELYAQLGYEVCADPVSPDQLAEDCEGCQLPALLQFRIIYTRKRKPITNG
ncbi:MAG: hypothetical protein GTN62_02290 [Gemmatimonadales bacterium]|nr:hypothetical protein [Gemmatimonadales bacterium]NIN10184.1 hypothetical protein [Gemmatimonadales bacterium]NIN48929.1 hypothetical protein [Gemmatimonadales bacterium]NIP06393.1 hypothetical protein [Gemmatimonadales bacterium]NIR01439.1 hypothetical protein [Gemmatimonadales bacterium]